MSKSYTSEVVEILDNGDAIIQLPDELCEELGWKAGDTLFISYESGCIVLEKIKKGDDMQYECEVCGHIHDETTMGKLEDLPKFANCPECGSDAREVYKPVDF